MNILGIDPSVICTGWCLIDTRSFQFRRGEIKSKKKGVQRLFEIENELGKLLPRVDFAVLERAVYGIRYPEAIANIELGAIIKRLLYFWAIQFMLVSPTTLKKFVTSSGKSPKNEILRDAYRKWKITGNEHVVEAYALAKIGEMVCKRNNKEFVSSLKEYEKEVLKTLCPDKYEQDRKVK